MKFKLLLPVIFITLCFNIYSQEEIEYENEIDNTYNEESIFVINSFNYNIRGMTRPFALARAGDLKTGTEITGFQELERYISEKTQLLYNQRVLDSVSLDYTVGEAGEDGKFPVFITINTTDSWNIIAIPRPQYSTNTGFELILKARDYNFLGTMVPLRFDIGYMYDEDENSIYIVELDANIPFTVLGFYWNFKFFTSYEYRPSMEEEQHFLTNTIGLNIELPVKTTTFLLGFNESFIYNQENSSLYKEEDGEYQFGFYMSSNPYISWRIPTGIEMGYYGDLVYTPTVSAVFNHEFPDWELLPHKKGPFAIFSHSLGFNRIDWIRNFRRGYDVSLYNSFQYDFYRERNDEKPWTGYFSFTGTGHFTITDFFGISGSLKYRQWLFYEKGNPEAGDVVRGIKNSDIRADYIVSLNLDFPFRILRFSPSDWFDNSRLRLFNFDLHMAPVVDFALYYDPLTHISFNHENNIVTGGIEFIVFPEFFRSLFLRVSLCFDIRDRSRYELFIGTEFHF